MWLQTAIDRWRQGKLKPEEATELGVVTIVPFVSTFGTASVGAKNRIVSKRTLTAATLTQPAAPVRA